MKKLFFLAFGGNIRQILSAAADRGIGRSATGHDHLAPAIDAAGRQTFTVDGLDQNAGYFL